MKCPKCSDGMEIFEYLDIEIDRCPACQGVWLDKGELAAIVSKNLASLFDAPTPPDVPGYSDQRPAHCYRCDQPMTVMEGSKGIRFDWCGKCEGIFLDPGELAELQED